MIFIFKWIPSNNSVTYLFLILQNYLRPFQTWRHPSSPNYSANQNAGTTKNPAAYWTKRALIQWECMITLPHATEAIRMQAFQTHTAAQPISIQPLQTQQKPHVTKVWHNAEKHFLFDNRCFVFCFSKKNHHFISWAWNRFIQHVEENTNSISNDLTFFHLSWVYTGQQNN